MYDILNLTTRNLVDNNSNGGIFLRLKIQLDIQRVPQHYRMYLLSFIKKTMRLGDEQLYKDLYGAGKKPKCLTFSFYMTQFKLIGDEYHMKNATLTFSTSDAKVAVAFINGISQTKKFEHLDYPFNIQNVQISNEKSIRTNVVKFTTLSPILLEDKQGKPLLISDATYEQELNIITNKKFESLYGRTLLEPIQVISHNLRKQVVKESNRHANDKTLFYTAQKGDITLKGHIDDLKLLYMDGILNRSAQGFGTLEVVNCYEDIN